METVIDREALLAKWANVLEQIAHVPSWTSGHELAWLCEMATKHDRIVEIGSYHGKSALAMVLANPDLQLLCIDNGENKEVPAVFAKNLAAQIREGRVCFKKGTSDLLKNSHDSFGMAFIDAGHTYADVMLDIENCRSVLFPGSLLCGHDWRSNDPKDGVNRAVIDSVGQPSTFESLWWVIV